MQLLEIMAIVTAIVLVSWAIKTEITIRANKKSLRSDRK